MEKFYLIWSCDEYKSYDSMELKVITTNWGKFLAEYERLAKEYSQEEDWKLVISHKILEQENKNDVVHDLNVYVDYLHPQIWINK